MKLIKFTLAAIVFTGFLAAGCARHTCPTYADTYQPSPQQAISPQAQRTAVAD